eukprot:1157683-Pelagomonas_calceolata.AAC.9
MAARGNEVACGVDLATFRQSSPARRLGMGRPAATPLAKRRVDPCVCITAYVYVSQPEVGSPVQAHCL